MINLTVHLAHGIAASNGFTVPFEKTMFSAAHTHSGPGAISPSFLWSIAPATDLLVPECKYTLTPLNLTRYYMNRFLITT